MATSFRSDVAAGLYGLLTGFQAANPTLLHNAYRSRPKNFADRPFGFVGPRNESMTHRSGLRIRTMAPTVVIVYAPKDGSEEVADIRDDVVDAFLDYASARPHAVSNRTLVEPTSVEDVELDMDGAFYPASVVSFNAVAQEGRP